MALATGLYLLPCDRKHAPLGLGLIAIIVDLFEKLLTSDLWGGATVTSRRRQVREAP
jgi:hypothetical protein